MSDSDGRSPWFYVAIGCGGMLFVLLVVVGLLTWVGVRTVKTISREMTDPVAREARALELLGAEALPTGYHAGPALSVPWIFDLVVLGDAEPDAGGQIPDDAEHQFIYMEVIRGGREWSEFVEGKGDPFDVLDGGNFNVERGESIQRADLRIGNQEIVFVSEHGSVQSEHGETEGLLSLMFIRCSDDKRMRLAIWIGPDPHPELSVGEADFSGSTPIPLWPNGS